MKLTINLNRFNCDDVEININLNSEKPAKSKRHYMSVGQALIAKSVALSDHDGRSGYPIHRKAGK